LNCEPDLLLRSDVATAKDEIKQRLVDEVLIAAGRDDFRVDSWKLRARYHKLNYPGLGRQLARKLRDPRLTDNAKVEAVEMIEACNIRELFPRLASIAIDGRKNNRLRQTAADIIDRLGDT